MHQADIAIEQLVDRICAARCAPVLASKAGTDRGFACLLAMLRPRIRSLVMRYGLADLREDAEQACAIAVHRALDSYDPSRARFTTHVTWQMRGELQGLRHRERIDQQPAVRVAGIRLRSLDGLLEAGAHPEIIDDAAYARLEGAASAALARRALQRLMEQVGSSQREFEIVLGAVFEPDREARLPVREREKRRQVVRRTFRNCAKAALRAPL